MLNCNECECDIKLQRLEVEIQEHKRRIGILESFVEWAEPVIRKIENMQKDLAEVSTSQRWMSVIFGGFVTIVAFVYVAQIQPSLDKQAEGDVAIIKEIHKVQLEVQKQLDAITLQVVTSSKINHNATVKNVGEMVKK